MIDKSEVWDAILFQYCDMDVLDTDHKWFRRHVTWFFKHYNPIFEEMLKSKMYDYDPLTDYARKLNRGTEIAEKIKSVDASTTNTIYEDQSTTSAQSTDVFSVSAFNNLADEGRKDTFADRNKTVSQTSGAGTDNATTNVVGMKDTSKVRTNAEGTTENEIGNNKYTFQQLIEQQRKVIEYDVLPYILNRFAKELLISVW